jgi:hypothetical protein
MRSSSRTEISGGKGGVNVPSRAATDEVFERTRSARVEAPRHPPGAKGDTTRFDREFHRRGHRDRIARGGDAGVHENGVDAELHRDCGIRRGADARVYDHGNRRALFDDRD